MMTDDILQSFLTDAWWCERCQIYYAGKYYCIEGYYRPETNDFILKIYRHICFKDDIGCCHPYEDGNGGVLGFEWVLVEDGPTLEELQSRFLKSPIFDGKTFFEVEDEIEFVEDGPIIKNGEKRDGGLLND